MFTSKAHFYAKIAISMVLSIHLFGCGADGIAPPVAQPDGPGQPPTEPVADVPTPAPIPEDPLQPPVAEDPMEPGFPLPPLPPPPPVAEEPMQPLAMKMVAASRAGLATVRIKNVGSRPVAVSVVSDELTLDRVLARATVLAPNSVGQFSVKAGEFHAIVADPDRAKAVYKVEKFQAGMKARTLLVARQNAKSATVSKAPAKVKF